jgi:hypothetical protein
MSIISASRKTDIPAFYSEWLINRIDAGEFMYRNPFNANAVYKVSLDPSVVDAIVFWTKDPKPMMNKLTRLDDYVYYFQFTLNKYGDDVEPHLPGWDSRKDTFIKLSEMIGRDAVIWRYDPILLSDKYDMAFHLDAFEETADYLRGYTSKAVISFVDFYRGMEKRVLLSGFHDMNIDEMGMLAERLSGIAQKYGLHIESCAEKIDLEMYGIEHGRCIDDRLIVQLTDKKYSTLHSLDYTKDKNQRLECGCMASVDMGEYSTCMHCCKYCYANQGHSEERIRTSSILHDPSSPMLLGNIPE